MILKKDRRVAFQNQCLRVFTEFTRTASEIATEQLSKTAQNGSSLELMHEMVTTATDILKGDANLPEFGRLLSVGQFLTEKKG